MRSLKNFITAISDDFSQTIPKSLVHKRNVENVYLTNISKITDDEYECATILPVCNIFFSQFEEILHKNIIFIIEISRQMSIAVTHLRYNIPLETNFIANSTQVSFLDSELSYEDIKEKKIKTRIEKDFIKFSSKKEIKIIRYNLSIYTNKKKYCQVSTEVSLHNAVRYKRLRLISRYKAIGSEKQMPKPSHNKSELPRDQYVKLIKNINYDTSNSIKADLIVDFRHPFFFDHFNDHISGMLIIAGLRQLVIKYIKLKYGDYNNKIYLTDFNLKFLAFGELDFPISISVLEEDEYLKVKVIQNEQIISQGMTKFYKK